MKWADSTRTFEAVSASFCPSTWFFFVFVHAFSQVFASSSILVHLSFSFPHIFVPSLPLSFLLLLGMEDWDLWLRLASHRWGGITIRDLLFWYRLKPTKRKWESISNQTLFVDFSQQLKQKYPKLYEKGMPNIEPPPPQDFSCGSYPSTAALPAVPTLAPLQKRLILIIPWLVMGGADEFNIQLVHQLIRLGWQVTVVQTLYHQENSWAIRMLYR